MFELDSNEKWIQKKKIVAQNRVYNERFGSAVSIYGNYAVIAPYQNTGVNCTNDPYTTDGEVFIYHRDSNGSWDFFQKLAALEKDKDCCYVSSVAFS